MIWQWYAFLAALIGGACLMFVVGKWFATRDGGSLIATGLAVMVLVMGFGISAIGISTGRHYGRVSCRNFAAQTNRPTKFVIYNSWSGGDCLTPDGHGRWIPTKNLREFGS